MRIILIIPLLILGILSGTSGCTVYKVDIQQGNTIEKEQLAKLQTGMTQREVQYLLGSSMLIDPFHANRWEYVYALRKGGEKMSQKRLTLYFKDGVLTEIDKSEYQEKILD